MNSLFSKTCWVCVSSLAFALACGSSGAGGEPAASPEAPAASPEAPAAEATGAEPATGGEGHAVNVALQAKSGSTLSGNATLTETPEGVKVELTVEHVSPGDHGAHVHEKGDCSAPDGASAGGHFNPASSQHALPSNEPRHLGDLGNIVVGADGTGKIEIVAPGANLKEGDPNSFLGKAIIVHEKKDDGGQPTGNAGGRIGCGEIKSS
ncbi:MAG TPA: superoxide dismutase family protein [Polyangiaceae bacterium]|nr:superoxide dismutase family protein [Polyangiaceae bacterium]